jgi:hypothetical protein
MSRAVIVYALILPLAIFLGYMLATPTDFESFAILLMAFGTLAIPLLLKSHHLMAVFTWNAALIVFFLPGQPQLGTVLAVISLTISIVTRTLSRKRAFISVPSVTLPLILITIIVLITAKFTGGIGARVLGNDSWGAKRYLGVFGAIVGYFALIAQPVPRDKANLYVTLFFLSGLTWMISDLVFMAGPQLYFLFVLFPSDYASLQALTADTLMRLSGLGFAAAWGYYFLLARYGIQGVFDLRAPWRLLLFSICSAVSLLGGFRGLLILLITIFVAQFHFEGVLKKRLGPILILFTLLIGAGAITFIDKMPLSVQRTFSFLPLDKIDASARLDAAGTLDWRLTIWKTVIPEIPKYLLLGKGYSYNGTDYYLTQEAVRKGMYNAYEDILISGNYHNGILTILIPFGIFGFGAFLWFCWSSSRVLYNNYRFGDPEIRHINTFLIAYFMSKLLFYMVFYGQFDLDLVQLTGLVGLSISMNNGMRTRHSVELSEEEVPAREITPIVRPALA